MNVSMKSLDAGLCTFPCEVEVWSGEYLKLLSQHIKGIKVNWSSLDKCVVCHEQSASNIMIMRKLNTSPEPLLALA